MQYPGALYHVMDRGDRREALFHNNADRELFLQTLEEACRKTDWQIHAWCLMTNHFHSVVETPRGNLAAGMKWLLGAYTMHYNRRQSITLNWIASRLRMGTPAHVAHLLYWRGRERVI